MHEATGRSAAWQLGSLAAWQLGSLAARQLWQLKVMGSNPTPPAKRTNHPSARYSEGITRRRHTEL